MKDNPWLQIAADDYEAHMRAVGQSAALREIFLGVYAKKRPTRLAVLGCTTGSDLTMVDPDITQMVVGVDVNSNYLQIARSRLSALDQRLHLVAGDVLQVKLPPVRFDLIHLALLLEYVDPQALFERVRVWLSADGLCSVVTQNPLAGEASVSNSGYNSLQTLVEHISLRNADEIASIAARVGLRLVDRRIADLPSGKSLLHSTFEIDSI